MKKVKKKSLLMSLTFLLVMAFAPIAGASGAPSHEVGGGGGSKPPAPVCDSKGNCILP